VPATIAGARSAARTRRKLPQGAVAGQSAGFERAAREIEERGEREQVNVGIEREREQQRRAAQRADLRNQYSRACQPKPARKAVCTAVR